MSALRETVILGGKRVYRDSVKIKELSAGGTTIVYCDGVEPGARDWSRDEKPKHANLVFNGPGSDRGPRT